MVALSFTSIEWALAAPLRGSERRRPMKVQACTDLARAWTPVPPPRGAQRRLMTVQPCMYLCIGYSDDYPLRGSGVDSILADASSRGGAEGDSSLFYLRYIENFIISIKLRIRLIERRS